MKKVGVIVSLCIHLAYAVASAAMFFGLRETLENGGMAQTVPEGIGAVGLIVVALLGALFVGVLLLLGISLAAVLFEICDLAFDKRGFSFAYGLISFGFLLFFGGTLVDTLMAALADGRMGTLWQSGEAYYHIGLTLSALIPTLVGARRTFQKR